MSHQIVSRLRFEELLPHFDLDGFIRVTEGPGGERPTRIIRTDQQWQVTFDWKTEGPLNYIMAGDWILRFYLEEMGEGEFKLDSKVSTEKVSFVSRPTNYKRTLVVSPKQVSAGLYRLVASVTMVGAGGQPGPIAGFAEAGVIQFYDGGPIS